MLSIETCEGGCRFPGEACVGLQQSRRHNQEGKKLMDSWVAVMCQILHNC